MSLRPGDVKLYSRNKNIIFESDSQGWIINKLATKIATKFSGLTISSSKTVFSERSIEYPLIFQYLDRDQRSILDFGCVEDLLPIHLASLGYNVTGLDFQPFPFTHPNFKFIQVNILNWKSPEEEYDCVISVSAIEHVGLGGYGDPVFEDGDKIAVQKLFTSLKKGGQLIITVPFGKFAIKRNMRIYNHEKLLELVPNIEIERFFFKASRYGSWVETTWQETNNLKYENYYTNSPVQGLAFVIAEKPH